MSESNDNTKETPEKTPREVELEARILAIASLGKQAYSAGMRDGAAQGYDLAIRMVESFTRARGIALGRAVPVGHLIERVAASLREARPRIFDAPKSELADPTPDPAVTP